MPLDNIGNVRSNTIGGASGYPNYQGENERNANTVSPRLQREDALEISDRARELSEKSTTENFAQVQSQINAGYYNRPDVLRQTAAKLAQSLRDTKAVSE